MLLLARRLNESFRIGDVLVKVVGFRGRQVVLGIEAPREVDIVRGELEGVNKPVNKRVNE
jgi:Carbon storage regulator (could also regulate swarming and quorum sensing)